MARSSLPRCLEDIHEFVAKGKTVHRTTKKTKPPGAMDNLSAYLPDWEEVPITQKTSSRNQEEAGLQESQEPQRSTSVQPETRLGRHTEHPAEEIPSSPIHSIQESAAGLMKNLSSLFGALSVAARGSGSAGHTAAQGAASSREDESRFLSRERLLLCPSPDTAQRTSHKACQGDVVVIVYDLETTGLGKTETIGICELG